MKPTLGRAPEVQSRGKRDYMSRDGVGWVGWGEWGGVGSRS